LSFVYSFFILCDLRRPHIEQTPTCEAIVATLSVCCCDGSGVASPLLLDWLSVANRNIVDLRRPQVDDFVKKSNKKINQKISRSLVETL